MSDVLKQVEEALVAALRLDQTCEHEDTHRGGAIWTICDQCGKQWADDEGGFQPDPPNATIEQICAALTALRGLQWLPIAELDDSDGQTFYAGRWRDGEWDWNIRHSRAFAMACGYTHFCRPLLPQPPQREVE